MAQAQEYCVAHKHHWMAASLLGSTDSYYNTSYSDINNNEKEDYNEQNENMDANNGKTK